MSHSYIIGIDETGSFEKHSKRVSKEKEKASRVGGVVFRNPRHQIVRNCMEETKNEWNQEHPTSRIEKIEQFHYFPLRGVKFGESSHGPVSREEGEALTDSLVTRLASLEEFAMAFSSQGFPPFFVNEQQAYGEILRTTLWGLLSDKLPLEEGDCVYVLVSPRSKAEGAFGFWKPSD